MQTGVLSAGFSGVAVEDAATLLDNTIVMLQELADVYDDENSEQLQKEYMKKLFATMSDRSSVPMSREARPMVCMIVVSFPVPDHIRFSPTARSLFMLSQFP